MAFSIHRDRTGPEWPLGYVNDSNNGTPVCLMVNVDANNYGAPNSGTNSNVPEYSSVCRAIGIQGYHPGNNNNGMVNNTGNIYLLRAPAGGSGNRSDPGAMVKIIPPGGDFFFTIDGTGQTMFSPYNYFIDSDVNNEGALCTLYGMGNP
jgi:hypothetical protein